MPILGFHNQKSNFPMLCVLEMSLKYKTQLHTKHLRIMKLNLLDVNIGTSFSTNRCCWILFFRLSFEAQLLFDFIQHSSFVVIFGQSRSLSLFSIYMCLFPLLQTCRLKKPQMAEYYQFSVQNSHLERLGDPSAGNLSFWPNLRLGDKKQTGTSTFL